MVTTKRLDGRSTSIFEQGSSVGVGLLDRIPSSYSEYVDSSTVETEETMEQARERMQRNLDKLLHYDQQETIVEETVAKVEEVEEVVTEVALQDDDIRPTLTTMQFGDEDIDTMKAEMRVDHTQKTTYALSGKGKMVMVLYSLAVVVVMALIVLNTGVLATLNKGNQVSAQALDAKKAEYQALCDDIDVISSNEYVLDKASGMGMIQR